MTQLILHPRTIELRRRRDLLRERLARLVSRRIEILFEEIPGLRHRYTELFGELEREVEEKTLEMSQRKRMMELFILKLNRGQELDEATISLTLKAVYREFERLRGQVSRMASTSGENRVGPSRQGSGPGRRRLDAEGRVREARIERKSIYRRLAKKLHPDINPNDDPLTRTYWELTQRAYQRDDLELLRTLVNVVESGPGIGREGRIESTAEEIVRLLELVDREEGRVAEIENSEPYSTRIKFDDGAWVSERQNRLREKIAKIEEETARYNDFLAPILSHGGERVTPESVGDIWSNFVEDVYLSGRF